MQKISDFFAIEAFFDDSKGSNLFYFYWDEGDEEYVFNYDTKELLVGNEKNLTWELIIDWYEDNKEEIDNMVKTKEIHYVKDVITI